MAPLVSIVIPTFDRPEYLKQAVVSALDQTYPNIEVRVANNGTTDVTLGWEQELLSDPRFSYRRNPRNLGMCGNFNALADAAEGEFMVAIGDDDRLLPNFVSRLMEEMRPEVSLVFCNHYLIDGEGRRLESESREQTHRYRRDSLRPGVLESAQIAAWQQSIAISATLMRTADMRRLRFREDLNTPDAEYFIRLAQEGGSFAFVPDYLVEYRVHHGTSTSGGLCTERLVEYLMPVEVLPKVESYKKRLFGPLLMNAVSRCLRNGEWERARKLLHSTYYPRHATLDSEGSENGARGFLAKSKRWAEETEHVMKSGFQHLCASLPGAIGRPAYRAVRAAKEWTRS